MCLVFWVVDEKWDGVGRWLGFFCIWEVQFFVLFVICFGYCLGQCVYVQDVVLVFGYVDCVVCIEQVEGVVGFYYLFVGWQWQVYFYQFLCFMFVGIEVVEYFVYVGVFEVVGVLFYFVLVVDVVVGYWLVVWVVGLDQVIDVVVVLQVYVQVFEIVGDFVQYWVVFQVIGLLEVGELGYFYVVELDFLVQVLGVQCW